MKDRLSKAEINKDALQETVEAGVQTVSQVMSIITGAVRDVTTTLGGFATDAFEIREGVRKAKSELAEEKTEELGD
ncbi:MAG TPA: hypothetical protein VJL80_15115 [Aeromicrobium sp.]|jgi:hypothetical protein|nr:hypothetical protein [Aeromicrobium sp.]HKY59366.1 hypothetical protein [Aeromicrobium sp.]